MLPSAWNSGTSLVGATGPASRGTRLHPNLPRSASPGFSCACKCEPARLLSLLFAAPQVPTLRTPPLSHLCAVRCQAQGCCGHAGCWQTTRVSPRTPALTPTARAERPQVGSVHPRARGEGRGRGTQHGRGAPQAETHPRTRRSRTGWSCWTLPSPRTARAAAGSAPGRTQPALPSPGRSQPPRPPAHGKVLAARSEHQPLDSACTSCSAR